MKRPTIEFEPVSLELAEYLKRQFKGLPRLSEDDQADRLIVEASGPMSDHLIRELQATGKGNSAAFEELMTYKKLQ